MLLHRHKPISILIVLILPLIFSNSSMAAIAWPVSAELLLLQVVQDFEDETPHQDKHDGKHGHQHESEHVRDEHEHGDDEHHPENELPARLALLASELKLEMMETELHEKRLQQHRIALERIYELALDSKKTSCFAIMHSCEILDEQEAFNLLTSCLAELDDDLLKRVLRLKLAQLSVEIDRNDVAKEHLRALILEK